MKIPIPDDFDDQWQCIEIQWPSSVGWLALLMGALSQYARGRFWDERTGTIKDAQAIGREIWERNTPLISCDGSGGENFNTASKLFSVLFSDCDCEGEDMSCAPCIKWVNGVLYVLSCGEWMAVSGDDGSSPMVVDTETGEVVDVSDPTTTLPTDGQTPTENVKCRVAYAIASAMWRVHEVLLDKIDDVTAIPFLANEVKRALPEYTLDVVSINNAIGYFVGATVGLDVDVLFGVEADFIPDMAAYLSRFLQSKYSVSKAEYLAIGAALLAYSLHEGIEVNVGQFVEGAYWENIFFALGPGTVNELAASGRYFTAGQYECDEKTYPIVGTIPTDPNGILTFSGDPYEITIPARFSLTSRSQSVIEFDVIGNQSDYINVGFKVPVAASGTVQEVELRFYATGDDPWKLPVNAWTSSKPAANNFTQNGALGTGSTKYYFPSHEPYQAIVWTWGTPQSLDGLYFNFSELRMWPQNDAANNGRHWPLKMVITYSGGLR